MRIKEERLANNSRLLKVPNIPSHRCFYCPHFRHLVLLPSKKSSVWKWASVKEEEEEGTWVISVQSHRGEKKNYGRPN